MSPDVVTSFALAIVAVLGAVTPFVTTVFLQWAKWRQDQRSAAMAAITEASAAFVTAIQPVVYQAYYDVESSQYRANDKGVDAFARYHIWEQAVWRYCNDAERKQIDALTTQVEDIINKKGGVGVVWLQVAHQMRPLTHAALHRLEQVRWWSSFRH